MKLLKKLMAVTTLLVLAGCASFPQEEIKSVESLPKVAHFKNKPKVFVDLKFFRGEPNTVNAIDITSQLPQIQNMAKKVFDENNLFESYTFDPFEKESTEYTITLHFYNHGSSGAAASGFISGLTLGIIPGSATDNYTLKSAVLGANGNEIARAQTKDSVTTWVGIWFIPAAGNTPQKAVEQTISNMIKDSLKSMIESKQLRYSSLSEPKFRG